MFDQDDHVYYYWHDILKVIEQAHRNYLNKQNEVMLIRRHFVD